LPPLNRRRPEQTAITHAGTSTNSHDPHRSSSTDTTDDPDDALSDALTRAQHGDEQAFRRVYRAVQPRLLNYLRALVGETDAEDVAAETWARIARDLPSFHGDADGFRAWASTIARHRATDHLRRRRPVTSLPHELLPHRPTPHDTASQAEETVTTRAALALIAQLPPNQAQAVLLRVVMGLDAPAAARVLGKRPGTIRTATHRGLRALARKLECDAETAAGEPGATPPRRALMPSPWAAQPTIK
jgi:RNA polymerase sigma-70 factor, ECF subfamily